MALPQNPKIGDIITELQDLTLINQKAEMAGVIGSPTTSTSNNQDFVETIQDAKDIIATKTGQDNTLGLIEMANSLVVGRRWDSGTVAVSNPNSLVVNGLSFRPSVIIVKSLTVTGNSSFGVYVNNITNPIFTSQISSYIKSSGAASPVITIQDDGFVFRDSDLGNGNQYAYLAFE